MGLRVVVPGPQGKLDVVRVQQETGRPRWRQEGKSVLCRGTAPWGLGIIRTLAQGGGHRADERDGGEEDENSGGHGAKL